MEGGLKPSMGTATKYYERSSVVSKVVPQSYIDTFKKYFFFRPEDTHGLHQVPPAKYSQPKVDRIRGYRYPAPGSQTTAKVPTLTNEDTKYDIKYFSRNTRRAGHIDADGKSNRFNEKFLSNSRSEIALIDDDAPIGSPGNHYTADTVAEYDPSKLRSAMTATHEETFKAIQEVMPDHLVTYDFEGDYEGLVASYESKGLPPTPGPASEQDFIVSAAKTAAW
jgi:hypothetical protein